MEAKANSFNRMGWQIFWDRRAVPVEAKVGKDCHKWIIEKALGGA
jgi:hypothetical protein